MSGSRALPLKVCVCDDSDAMRRLLALQLEEVEVTVTGECADAAGCVALLREHQPDVVLIDHGLAPGDACGFFEGLREAAPETALVLFSGLPRDVLAERAARFGADGFAQKGEPLPALRRVMDEAVARR